ncbi:MAG TPA: hypothetical protein VNG32_03655 [Candidatus Dormibacteraeota bacterium]|nr:hypothetical protein [Candidatus Dormibacteraeota bacterium]
MSEFFFAHHAALLEQAKIRQQQAAAQIAHMRLLEQIEPEYIKDSSILDYLKSAKGLQAFLTHSRSRSVPNVLEIGSGTATALTQIAESQFGEGLSFIGTNLTHRPKPDTPQVVLRQTPAEVLDGFAPQSVGGILSIGAIAFSAAPELVIDSIDRTLVKGAAIKATFRAKHSYGPEWDGKYDAWGYGPHDAFSKELRQRRFDVAIMETEVDDVLVAIKPGVRKIVTARELLEQDSQTLHDQLDLLTTQ